MAEEAGFDYEALWAEHGDDLAPMLEEMKANWIEGNPYYERMEGVVAGTPSLAEYDVILDAGSSAAEDPESAVPFDLELSDGTTLKQPGNLFNLTEGALWGTLPEDMPQSTPADLDGNGTEDFGEVLPDAPFLLAVRRGVRPLLGRARRLGRGLGAERVRRLHGPRRDGADDERVLRPVEGVALRARRRLRVASRSTSSRGSRTSTTSSRASRSSSRASRDGSRRSIPEQAEQTGRELTDLRAFVEDLYSREQGGERFTPEQAEVLGTEAQERATAIAGQVSQAAAELGVTIEQ